MLLTLPELLTAKRAAAMVQRLQASSSWQHGRSTAGAQAAQAKHNQQLPADSTEAVALAQDVQAAFKASALFFSAALPRHIGTPQFNRYQSIGAHGPDHYANHVDQAVRHEAALAGPLRSDWSVTLFLSDPACYGGGELVVREALAERAFKLPAGHALLYPASHVHRVEPVTQGTRLAAFFWVQSLVPGLEQRRLLFEMDLALTALRQRERDASNGSGTESAEAVALTGCYHNLLRLWAQT